MQLAGDAQPFLVEAAAGVLFGPVADGVHVSTAVGHRDPGHHHHGDHEGRMSTPPPNGPSGLTAMLAEPSTTSVRYPVATAWRMAV